MKVPPERILWRWPRSKMELRLMAMRELYASLVERGPFTITNEQVSYYSIAHILHSLPCSLPLITFTLIHPPSLTCVGLSIGSFLGPSFPNHNWLGLGSIVST